MACPTPVETVVKYSGRPGVIVTPFGDGSAGYDPAAPGKFTPGAPQRKTVYGVFSDEKVSGMSKDIVATFLIEAECLPTELRPQQSSLEFNGVTYQIDSYRTRVYLGEIDGYDLYLTR